MRRIVRGMLAGAVATLAMDLVWYRRYKRDGGSRDFAAWEFATALDEWDEAPAPAQVGHRVIKNVTGRDLEACAWSSTLNNVVHWSTGTAWGALFGAVGSPALTPPFTLVVWAVPYLALAPSGIYKPMWEYDAKTIWKDLSAHLVYGAALSATFVLISRG